MSSNHLILCHPLLDAENVNESLPSLCPHRNYCPAGKRVVFSVVMYGCESWTIKKAEHQRIDTFKLLCWRSLLRLPWTARRLNQPILKEISSEYLLEGLMLKLQYLGHLMRRADSLEKILMLGKTEGEEGDRGCDGWMASPIHWT